jgi:hypothetical protein
MTRFDTDPEWLGIGLILVLLLGVGYWGLRAYQRRARRKSLLRRLERVAFEAAHQVLVPDGMGGFIHIDHLLLTPRGVLVLDTRRILVGDVPVEGRLLFSNVGKFTKGIPKWVVMLNGIEVEFPVVDRSLKSSPDFAGFAQEWSQLLPQLQPSPHLFTNL